MNLEITKMKGIKFINYISCNFVKLPNSVGIVPDNPRFVRDLFFYFIFDSSQIFVHFFSGKEKEEIQLSDSFWI